MQSLYDSFSLICNKNKHIIVHRYLDFPERFLGLVSDTFSQSVPAFPGWEWTNHLPTVSRFPGMFSRDGIEQITYEPILVPRCRDEGKKNARSRPGDEGVHYRERVGCASWFINLFMFALNIFTENFPRSYFFIPDMLRVFICPQVDLFALVQSNWQ